MSVEGNKFDASMQQFFESGKDFRLDFELPTLDGWADVKPYIESNVGLVHNVNGLWSNQIPQLRRGATIHRFVDGRFGVEVNGDMTTTTTSDRMQLSYCLASMMMDGLVDPEKPIKTAERVFVGDKLTRVSYTIPQGYDEDLRARLYKVGMLYTADTLEAVEHASNRGDVSFKPERYGVNNCPARTFDHDIKSYLYYVRYLPLQGN